MSRENLESFYQEVLQDQALQERFRTITDANSLAVLAVELGQEKGLNFSLEEVKIYSDDLSGFDSEQELSDELLESVAGGLSINGICWNSKAV